MVMRMESDDQPEAGKVVSFRELLTAALTCSPFVIDSSVIVFFRVATTSTLACPDVNLCIIDIDETTQPAGKDDESGARNKRRNHRGLDASLL
ncbi:hypothetical protein F441_06184 [Phytophthora nicotianae CJ01A1]|uniref:Uncharacterized protein n=3 Tax=Phytophthora nicotianae TaxID=4792 RepID=W2ZLN4_PHYNI|nr:hypothetical protein F444_06235 [Phytophthora nicotianae P1976]ETP19970.1 hypothetical protein F441_06184 [Phytophthora nicotianae CJ01A1]ETP47950.1 hypothetical protein F442_06211 [Phytophthora nicotianae P10297]